MLIKALVAIIAITAFLSTVKTYIILTPLRTVGPIEFHKRGIIKGIKGIVTCEFTISLQEFTVAASNYKIMRDELKESMACRSSCETKLESIDTELKKINNTFMKIEAAMTRPVKKLRVKRSWRRNCWLFNR